MKNEPNSRFAEEDGRVAQPFGFALTDPYVRLSRIKCVRPHFMRYVAAKVMWRLESKSRAVTARSSADAA
jgi:hypothetical protein